MPKGSKIFTTQEARESFLAKLRKAGAKGSASPITTSTSAPKRAIFEESLRSLENERAIFVDRSKAKPKYLLQEFAPSAKSAGVKIEKLAESKHPLLLAAADFKKVLSPLEKPLLDEALQALEKERRLVRLVRGRINVFAHAASLRMILGAVTAQPIAMQAETPTVELVPERIHESYQALVERTGYPEVEIAALQREVGAPMDPFKKWLIEENAAGRAHFSIGDWSLSDEATREGVIELGGDRNLFVILES